MDNAGQRYQIFNPRDENCPMCAALNCIHRADSLQNDMKIPEEIGKGYYRKIIVKPTMNISISDITFYKRMTMYGSLNKSLDNLIFCLGEEYLWRIEEDKREYALTSGESCILSRNRGKTINSSCQPGQRYVGFNIVLDSQIITRLMEQKTEHVRPGQSPSSGAFYSRKISPTVKRILCEIMNCRYRDSVKRIYLEGKILELVAVYLDEAVFENGARHSAGKFSAYDRDALYKARRILDENLAEPPTLEKLAKYICLNERKLKTGFKELFGLPVHAYIIDKRLEYARLLIEDKMLSVTEVALLVGYNDLSYFAEKFREKYGVNPSQYSKNI